MTAPIKVPCKPKIGVVKMGLSDMAVGMAVKATMPDNPADQASCDLVGDCFQSLYQSTPTIKSASQVPERSVNQAVLDWASQSPDWNTTRSSTSGNIPASLVTTPLLWSGLTSDSAVQQAMNKQTEAEQQLSKEQDNLKQASKHAADGNESAMQDCLDKASQAHQSAMQAMSDGVQQIDKLKNNPLKQGMVNNAIKQAGETADKVASFCKGWGIDPGNGIMQDADTISKLAMDNQRKIADIAKLAGRLKGVATSTIQSVRLGYTGPIAEIDLTQDVSRILPSELAKLSNSIPLVVRLPQLYAFMTDGLPGWRSIEQGNKQGHVQVLLDGSGSFVSSFWVGAAIALGLAWAVKDDKDGNTTRLYNLATFGSKHDDILSVGHNDGWKQHIEWASYCPAGGTDFDTAFSYAIKSMTDMDKTNVDLIFITDGYALLSDDTIQQWHKFVESSGSRLHYVSVDSLANDQLRALCTTFINVSSTELENNPDSIVIQISKNIADADYESQD